MFIEKYFLNKEDPNSILLAFPKSLNVEVYPCGRRRSTLVTATGAGALPENDQYYIPFDPEARLNTEANNRKHSAVNGFTNSFLQDWDKIAKKLSFVLAGYSFNISLTDSFVKEVDFASNLLSENILNDSEAARIYVNIRLEEVPLFAGNFASYNTFVLRNQSDTAFAEPMLDLIRSKKNDSDNIDVSDENNYYFSGLSFSTRPITGEVSTRSSLTVTGTPSQQVFSLCILEKDFTGTWKIHEQARLPHIEHGSTENSIKLDKVDVSTLTCDYRPVSILEVTETTNDSGDTVYRLQFSPAIKQ